MNDIIDAAIFYVAYDSIAESQAKRVTGSTIWEKARLVIPDLAPVTVPARLHRTCQQGIA